MKSAIVMLLTGFLLLASLGSAMGTWQQGEGWGYKWVIDNESDYGNHTFNGTATGKDVLGLYVEYEGEDNGLHNFSYIGSFYTYYTVNGTLVMNTPHTLKDTWYNSSGFFWINYEGYILLEKCNVTDMFGKKHMVYAIKEQYMHIYSKEPLRLDVDMDTNTSKLSYHYRANYTGSFDITLKVFYSQPVSYIPINSPDTISYYSKVNFTGHVNAKATGYSSFKGQGGLLNKTIDMNNTIDRDVKGSLSVLVKMDVDGNNVTRASLLEALPTVFSELPGMFVDPENYISSQLRLLFLLPNEATFDGDFYESIYLGHYVIGLQTYKSENATKDDVEKIRTEAPQIYGPAEAEMGLTDYLIIAVSIVIAVIVILIVVLLITKKKGQSGTT